MRYALDGSVLERIMRAGALDEIGPLLAERAVIARDVLSELGLDGAAAVALVPVRDIALGSRAARDFARLRVAGDLSGGDCATIALVLEDPDLVAVSADDRAILRAFGELEGRLAGLATLLRALVAAGLRREVAEAVLGPSPRPGWWLAWSAEAPAPPE